MKERNMSELTRTAFIDCLLKKDEDTTNYVKVEGIFDTYGLHPRRLEEKRKLVASLLAELPTEFKSGWSFLELCYTKNGDLWTGDQRLCEQLMVMAIGLNLMSYAIPKEFWGILPGGVPYIIIK